MWLLGGRERIDGFGEITGILLRQSDQRERGNEVWEEGRIAGVGATKMVKDAGGTLADFSDGKRIVRNRKCEVRVEDVYFQTLWFLTNPLASVRVRVCRPKEPCVRAFFLFGARHAFAVRVKITRTQV